MKKLLRALDLRTECVTPDGVPVMVWTRLIDGRGRRAQQYGTDAWPPRQVQGQLYKTQEAQELPPYPPNTDPQWGFTSQSNVAMADYTFPALTTRTSSYRRAIDLHWVAVRRIGEEKLLCRRIR